MPRYILHIGVNNPQQEVGHLACIYEVNLTKLEFLILFP